MCRSWLVQCSCHAHSRRVIVACSADDERVVNVEYRPGSQARFWPRPMRPALFRPRCQKSARVFVYPWYKVHAQNFRWPVSARRRGRREKGPEPELGPMLVRVRASAVDLRTPGSSTEHLHFINDAAECLAAIESSITSSANLPQQT